MSKKMKSITFKGEKTVIKFHAAEQMRGYNEVVEETNQKISDMIRHKKFNEAMSAMTPHLAIAYGFETPYDTTGVLFNMDFFTKAEWKDSPRFNKLTLTGVIVTGKDAADGIQLVGTIETPSGDLSPLKTPPISLLRTTEGYNYSLVDVLSIQWQLLEERAHDFLNGVTGAIGVQASMKLDTPIKTPQNTLAKKVIAQAGAVVN